MMRNGKSIGVLSWITNKVGLLGSAKAPEKVENNKANSNHKGIPRTQR